MLLMISLPQFSKKIACVLREGKILQELDNFIGECSHHVLSVGNTLSKSDYDDFGSAVYNKYPCISFPFPGKKEKMGESYFESLSNLIIIVLTQSETN